MTKTAKQTPHILTNAGRSADIMKQGFAKRSMQPRRNPAAGFDPKNGKYGWLGENFFKRGW